MMRTRSQKIYSKKKDSLIIREIGNGVTRLIGSWAGLLRKRKIKVS